MASINGVTIKNLKSFMGHEGECLQGNVYIDGKKQGPWTQDPYGGEDDFYFDTKLLEERVEKYVESYGEGGINANGKTIKYKDIIGLESMMSDIAELIYDEKIYKKNAKGGWGVTIIVNDGYHVGYVASSKTNKEDALAECESYIEDIMLKGSKITATTYTSLGDFDIICDKSHPVPEKFTLDETSFI